MEAITATGLDMESAGRIARQSSAESTRHTLAAIGSGGIDTTASKDEQLDQALTAFQNILLSQMLKAMRDATPKYEVFGSGKGEDIFQSFLDEEYVHEMGRRMGSLGLTDALKRQLGLDNPGVKPARENLIQPASDVSDLLRPPMLPDRGKEVSDSKV